MMKKRKSRAAAAAAKEEPHGKAAVAAGEEEEAREPVAGEVAAEITAKTEEEEGWRKRAGLMVSEQVPLGAMWLPSWDVQIMAESYVTSFYSDVWDGYDDIWGLRTPPPPPPPRPT